MCNVYVLIARSTLTLTGSAYSQVLWDTNCRISSKQLQMGEKTAKHNDRRLNYVLPNLPDLPNTHYYIPVINPHSLIIPAHCLNITPQKLKVKYPHMLLRVSHRDIPRLHNDGSNITFWTSILISCIPIWSVVFLHGSSVSLWETCPFHLISGRSA